MLLTPATIHSRWPEQTVANNMNNNASWPLAPGVPFPDSSSQQVADPAQLQQPQQQSSNLASTQADSLARASSGSQGTGMLQHNGRDSLSLKEKNRNAQRKFRQKQKAKLKAPAHI